VSRVSVSVPGTPEPRPELAPVPVKKSTKKEAADNG
jgi:hypothetical protein